MLKAYDETTGKEIKYIYAENEIIYIEIEKE